MHKIKGLKNLFNKKKIWSWKGVKKWGPGLGRVGLNVIKQICLHVWNAQRIVKILVSLVTAFAASESCWWVSPWLCAGGIHELRLILRFLTVLLWFCVLSFLVWDAPHQSNWFYHTTKHAVSGSSLPKSKSNTPWVSLPPLAAWDSQGLTWC